MGACICHRILRSDCTITMTTLNSSRLGSRPNPLHGINNRGSVHLEVAKKLFERTRFAEAILHSDHLHGNRLVLNERLGNSGTKAAVNAVFLGGDDAAGLANRSKNCFLVEGLYRERVDDLDGNALLLEHVGSLESLIDHHAASDDGGVGALAQHVCAAEFELDALGDVECVEVEPAHTPVDQDDAVLKAQKQYTPDSVYSSIDGLRAIAVFFMVVKNAVGRFTSMSNPLAKALGADWIPPVFMYAAGARLVAEQEKLKETFAHMPKNTAAYKRFRAETFLKQYIKYILVCSRVIFACFFPLSMLLFVDGNRSLCLQQST